MFLTFIPGASQVLKFYGTDGGVACHAWTSSNTASKAFPVLRMQLSSIRYNFRPQTDQIPAGFVPRHVQLRL